MPDSLLQILKLCLLALILLFFLRVLRAVWAGLKAPVLAVAAAPVAPQRTPAGKLRLKIVEPPAERGRMFDLTDELTVGRAAGCGVSLDDASVSQLHARLFRRDGRLWIEDLGSTNGTFVNRRKVASPAALRRGDRVQVGGTVLEVAR